MLESPAYNPNSNPTNPKKMCWGGMGCAGNSMYFNEGVYT